MPLYLDVACNDPDNGLFYERADQLNIGDAELEPRHYYAPPRFVELPDAIRLAGKTWQCESSTYGVGNWCWNRYVLAPKGAGVTHRWYMVEFLTWLRRRKLFHCSTAPSEFFEWFNGDDTLAPADVHRIVVGLE